MQRWITWTFLCWINKRFLLDYFCPIFCLLWKWWRSNNKKRCLWPAGRWSGLQLECGWSSWDFTLERSFGWITPISKQGVSVRNEISSHVGRYCVIEGPWRSVAIASVEFKWFLTGIIDNLRSEVKKYFLNNLNIMFCHILGAQYMYWGIIHF